MSSTALAPSAALSDAEVLERPIIVLGAPRSGTKVLSRVLEAHADVVYLREPRIVWRHGNDEKSDMLRAEDARPEVRSFIRRTFAQMVREGGGRRLLEKTPSNALRPAFVDAVFPDARFIHIMRDPVDTIVAIRRCWIDPPLDIRGAKGRRRFLGHLRTADWRQLPHYAKELVQEVAPKRLAPVVGVRPWGPRLPGLDGLTRDLDLLDVCAIQWRMCVEETVRYGRRLGPDRYVECHLEDLDEDRLRELLAFCDLDDEASVLGAYRDQYVPASVLRRGGELDASELRRVMAWIEPTLAWLEAGARSPGA